MSACGYKFYRPVFNSISQVRNSKITFVSTRGHVISSIIIVNACPLESDLRGVQRFLIFAKREREGRRRYGRARDARENPRVRW